MNRRQWREEFGWSFTLYMLLVVLLLAAALSGCVRTITTCVTYDRQLRHPDPNTWQSRDAAGASVCAEIGPRGE